LKFWLAIFKKNVPLKIESAKASRQSAAANETQTRKDNDRFQALLKNQTVDKQRSDQANLSWKMAQAEQTASEAGHTQSKKQLSEAKLGWEQISAKEIDSHHYAVDDATGSSCGT